MLLHLFQLSILTDVFVLYSLVNLLFMDYLLRCYRYEDATLTNLTPFGPDMIVAQIPQYGYTILTHIAPTPGGPPQPYQVVNAFSLRLINHPTQPGQSIWLYELVLVPYPNQKVKRKIKLVLSLWESDRSVVLN